MIVILTLFLISIILIQRGKGGGLAGAFGGMGGSSAFGTKTGDVFTKITVGVAIAWILLSMLMVVLTNRKPRSAWDRTATCGRQRAAIPGKSKAKDKSTGRRRPRSEAARTPIDAELPDRYASDPRSAGASAGRTPQPRRTDVTAGEFENG